MKGLFQLHTHTNRHIHIITKTHIHSRTHGWSEQAEHWGGLFSSISREATQICILLSNPPPQTHPRDTHCCCSLDKLVLVCSNTHTHGSSTWDDGGMTEFLGEMNRLVRRRLVKLFPWKTTEKCSATTETHTHTNSSFVCDARDTPDHLALPGNYL